MGDVPDRRGNPDLNKAQSLPRLSATSPSLLTQRHHLPHCQTALFGILTCKQNPSLWVLDLIEVKSKSARVHPMPEGSCNSSPSSLLFSRLTNSNMVFLSHSHNFPFHLINLDPKLQRTKTKFKTAQLSTFLHNKEPRKEIEKASTSMQTLPRPPASRPLHCPPLVLRFGLSSPHQGTGSRPLCPR